MIELIQETRWEGCTVHIAVCDDQAEELEALLTLLRGPIKQKEETAQ